LTWRGIYTFMRDLHQRRKKSRRWFRRILWIVFGLLFGWGLLTGRQVLDYARLNPDASGDAAVVLGAAVYRDLPSPVFRERINHAIDLYRQGKVEAIIFTGGVGRGDNLAESEAARNYAVAAGVPAGDIWIETVSVNTYQNLEQAQAIVEAQGFETVIIVSDPMHMRRAMEYAADLDLPAEPSPTPTSRYRSVRSQSSFLLREVYFLSLYRLLPDQF
jgi:uncharacterized SAM-binding protein YcdF (DUF218 family)